MNVFRLVLREILYRKLNFALGVVSVVVAVGCLVAELTLLRAHDLRTEAIVARKEAETKLKMDKLEDDYRKIMKKLGFNVLILPKEQNVHDLFAKDFAAKTMPEEYVTRLSESRIMTVRHLLPVLQQKIEWPERQRLTIILVGTRGEVPLLHRSRKKPMIKLVERDTMVVGYQLHHSLGLSVGSKVRLLGHDFAVTKCHPERGTRDDITTWINLGQAQELLGMEGRINGILALQCFCEGANVAKIRRDIASILPDTHVLEKQSKVLIRAEARARAAIAAQTAIEDEKANRARLRGEREGFAAILVPLVVVGCTVWVGFLAFSNVRERSLEIGILRALGLRRTQVFAIFLGKAVLTGLVGAALGYVGGAAIGIASGEVSLTEATATALFAPGRLALVLLLAPVLSALASWIPATTAAQQDPAVVLMNG